MTFNFSHRVKLNSDLTEQIKRDITSKCANPCATGAIRGVGCACYSEFASQYWMRLGGFSRKTIEDQFDVSFLSEPNHLSMIEKFESNIRESRDKGRSAVISGPQIQAELLAARLTKSIIKWELEHDYNLEARSLFFTVEDFTDWLKKCESKAYYAKLDKEYMDGVMTGSVLVLSGVKFADANTDKLVAFIKNRIDNYKSTFLITTENIEHTSLYELIRISSGWIDITLRHDLVNKDSGWV